MSAERRSQPAADLRAGELHRQGDRRGAETRPNSPAGVVGRINVLSQRNKPAPPNTTFGAEDKPTANKRIAADVRRLTPPALDGLLWGRTKPDEGTCTGNQHGGTTMVPNYAEAEQQACSAKGRL